MGPAEDEENITNNGARIIKEESRATAERRKMELGRLTGDEVVDSNQMKETEKRETTEKETKQDEEAEIFLTYDILCGKFRER